MIKKIALTGFILMLVCQQVNATATISEQDITGQEECQPLQAVFNNRTILVKLIKEEDSLRITGTVGSCTLFLDGSLKWKHIENEDFDYALTTNEAKTSAALEHMSSMNPAAHLGDETIRAISEAGTAVVAAGATHGAAVAWASAWSTTAGAPVVSVGIAFTGLALATREGVDAAVEYSLYQNLKKCADAKSEADRTCAFAMNGFFPLHATVSSRVQSLQRRLP